VHHGPSERGQQRQELDMEHGSNPNPAKCAHVVRRMRSGPLYVVVRCAMSAGHAGPHQKVVVR